MDKVNQITITGYLGQDAEFKPFSNGDYGARFSISHSQRVQDGQGYNGSDFKNVFYDVDYYVKKTKDYILNGGLPKGAFVQVTGELVTDEWDSPEGKQKKVKIKARSVVVSPGKSGSQQHYAQQQQAQPQYQQYQQVPPPQPMPQPVAYTAQVPQPRPSSF
jgi:single stranded DNA-binding protein